MGRRIISFILCLVLACANIAAAENAADEYAWLDDLTINQLKALDKEIHKRIPAESTNEEGKTEDNGILNLLLNGEPSKAAEPELRELKVNEKVITDTAEFEILSLSFKGTRDGNPSGYVTFSGSGFSGQFLLDSDCGALAIVYRVKNISNSGKWFWPSNLKVLVHWDEYEFNSMTATPMGDLQPTQTKTYITVVEIPNKILKKGCKDISIELGFKESFPAITDLKYADHRFVIHTGY